MKESRKQKWILRCDGGILFAGIFLALALGLLGNGLPSRILLAASLLCAGAAGADLVLRMKRGGSRGGAERPFVGPGALGKDSPFTVRELVLLDEDNKPLKSWDLIGKTALIIGKKDQDAEVDVDLGDCAYGAFIEPQHALLNFSGERWFLEDVSQENGVRVKKAEDGMSYKLSGRPCQVGAGDVIFIANTRLLLT